MIFLFRNSLPLKKGDAMDTRHLRLGLLRDLGFTSAHDLAVFVDFRDIDHLAAALDRTETPSAELMQSLLRAFLPTPAMYFVDSVAA